MILSLYRTVSELSEYLESIEYPKRRLAAYVIPSVILGIILSGGQSARDLPVLQVTAILFGFTINAVVMLGNSSEHYLNNMNRETDGQNGQKYPNQLETLYVKTLSISIHTLGIGIITILAVGIYQLFPGFSFVLQFPATQSGLTISVIGSIVYASVAYYLITFTVVIATVAELVKIRIE